MARSDYRQPDHYARRAREEGFSARSVFKLEEIDAGEHLLRAGLRVLDLGAAPGSWMQYAAAKVGRTGRVVGVDLKPLARALRPNERFLAADVMTLDPGGLEGPFDLVLSDLMSSTMGHKESDHYRSAALAGRALELADAALRPGGNFLVKLFQGPDFESFRARMREGFAQVKVKKPRSSRSSSREIYLLGLDKLPGQGG